ncbi:MAG: RagB/SusD family nutrient uptake outer membrane protein, partial [Prevotella sp.]|nr:RagB/SusD family nutrient uptake outer membrane protein [Prevotella sp.]
FLLLRQYGPIVIADKSIALDALAEDLFQKRSKVEDCFDYIIRLMDEAIADLRVYTEELELGRINKAIAASIKARVMLYRASPFYNGNSLYYVDFLDFDGEPFFPMEYDREKWKDALDAIDTAIVYCENNGIELYEFDQTAYPYDREDYAVNKEAMQTLYNLRMLIADPWNKELIWGQTYDKGRGGDILPSYCNIRLPKGQDSYGGITENNASSWQAGAASYAAMERYYTKNGLPLDYDKTFNKSTMYDIVRTPGYTDGERYTRIRGIMKPEERTVRMYMDREPRFYANLGITGGYWRAHALRINTFMLATTAGGYNTQNFLPFFLVTGIGIQKLVHPESKSGGWDRVIRCPQPIIRMADLYLMRAEALNEYYGETAHAEAYKEINKVRRRAGIPDVEVVWSDPNLTRQVGRHTTQEGLRAIILEERGNEFAFEGMRFWDMYRTRKAVAAFSAPIMGWNYKQAYINEFFVPTTIQTRRFLIRDYLWPISVGEINKNSNLIQNPGW